MNRRECLYRLQALGLLSVNRTVQPNEDILTRAIPATGEKLPVVGVGTWQTFDVGASAGERDPLKEVLKTLVSKGGTVIDSSPMYGRSEEVVGTLSSTLGLNDDLFMATKVWTTGKDEGIRQMNESLRRMRRETMDLMQIHNLVDWQTHLKTLRQWKEDGKIKYIGITHYTAHAYDKLASIISREPIDFMQINYNLVEREAEQKLLPLAREKNVAVLVNQPFNSGSLFRAVKGKPLPAWAETFDCHTWAQFFLKFILSHPAVTCVIPGTDNPSHMLDNLGAGIGKLPDANLRKKMLAVL